MTSLHAMWPPSMSCDPYPPPTEWRSHTGYFECNKYKGDKSDVTNRAKQALEKYLFYYERVSHTPSHFSHTLTLLTLLTHPHTPHTPSQWANHVESLRLEEQTKKKIVDRIEEKVSTGNGTWIDWQYLLDAVALLRKVYHYYLSDKLLYIHNYNYNVRLLLIISSHFHFARNYFTLLGIGIMSCMV